MRNLAGLAGDYLLCLAQRKQPGKVLIIPQFDIPGGTRNYFYSVVEYCREREMAVSVLLKEEQQFEEVTDFLRHHDCRIIVSNYQPADIRFTQPFFSYLNVKPLKAFREEINYFRSLLSREEFSNIFISVSTPDNYIPLFFLPYKIIYALHSMPWYEADRVKSGFLQKRISGKKILLTVSGFCAARLSAFWHIPGAKIKVIHNYYRASSDAKVNDEFGGITVLTLGTFGWFKNPELWVETAKEIIERYKSKISVRFIWAGEGALKDECIAAAKGNPLIHFMDFQKNVDALYSMAQIYFQPSVMESHGISVVGAMAHGLPCVVSANTGMIDSVKDGETGFYFSLDEPGSAAQKLSLLIEDDALRKQMGARGLVRYADLFTKEKWEACMNELQLI